MRISTINAHQMEINTSLAEPVKAKQAEGIFFLCRVMIYSCLYLLAMESLPGELTR